jgi:RimJ/RimL family protein N-acetyltransferase
MLSLDALKEIFSTQRLKKSDLECLKSIRLESLKKEPNVFGSTFESESQMTDGEWLDMLGNKSCAYFVLKVGADIVGLTGIYTNKDNKAQAKLFGSYIREEYRGRGGSELLYKARLDWAKENGFTEVIVSHRASNISSKMANQKHGFEYTHSEPHTWNDGKTEDNVFYMLTL